MLFHEECKMSESDAVMAKDEKLGSLMEEIEYFVRRLELLGETAFARSIFGWHVEATKNKIKPTEQ
jgi:hypothetical protein